MPPHEEKPFSNYTCVKPFHRGLRLFLPALCLWFSEDDVLPCVAIRPRSFEAYVSTMIVTRWLANVKSPLATLRCTDEERISQTGRQTGLSGLTQGQARAYNGEVIVPMIAA